MSARLTAIVNHHHLPPPFHDIASTQNIAKVYFVFLLKAFDAGHFYSSLSQSRKERIALQGMALRIAASRMQTHSSWEFR